MYLVFDIGGTNFRLALSKDGRRFGTPVYVPVPKKYAEAMRLFGEAGRRLTAGRRMRAVSGGLAGPLDAKKTTLDRSTHLPQFVHKPIARDLQKMFHTPVFLENDNALVALGEAMVGAGKGYPIVGYIGIGTGVGGARIVDGRIDRNAFGFEPGHHFFNFAVRKHRHPSPHRGDWESFVSGSGIEARYGQSSKTINSAAVWREMAYLTALGCINVAMFWSPDAIVLGGSLMKRLQLPLVRKEYRRHTKIFTVGPKILKGALGDFGGLYGALAHITSRLGRKKPLR